MYMCFYGIFKLLFESTVLFFASSAFSSFTTKVFGLLKKETFLDETFSALIFDSLALFISDIRTDGAKLCFSNRSTSQVKRKP